MLKKILFVILFVVMTPVLFAQSPSKEDLQRKTQDLKREIDNLNKSLADIKKNRKGALVTYNLIRNKIVARERLVQNINKEVRVLDDNIYLSSLEINKLKKELDTLKTEYSQSLVFAYKNRSNYDYLNFIFSAATFNDAIKRITYLKSYRQYREQQVDNINKTQDILQQKIASLNSNKTQKSQTLQEQTKQLVDLEKDRKEQNQEVSKLKSQENNLAAQIRKREKERVQMQNAIAAAVRREQAEARKKALAIAKQKADDEKRRRDAAASNPGNPVKEEPVAVVKPKPGNRTYSPFESTEEGKAASINFESGRGRLPWPVDAGFVSIHFGRYNIPGTTLYGQSDGITISLPVGASVKAISDGEVTSVFDLGGEQAVLVRHGKYFSTYSHLASVNVSRNQKLGAGTLIGRSAANDDGEGEVLFMVSNERGQAVDPEGWLRRR
ncbi:MAG: peptidoglycan DD-metalloendopeptidase family protein [Chitinophagaceae bacterium]|nr:peptidoglycan DD-metalloendopeptidase family protein [Chitinophagaceae bacterium]